MTDNPLLGIYGDFLHNGTEVELHEQRRNGQRFLIAPRCLSLDEPRRHKRDSPPESQQLVEVLGEQ